jgi:hypothetical protein
MRLFSLTAVVIVGLIVGGAPTEARAEIDCGKIAGRPYYTQEDLKAPMRFFYPEEYICFGNALNFPYLAVGVITDATPRAFAEFVKSNSPSAPIELISPGGNLLAALKLGEMIRNGGYDTSLGDFCVSACAYAILGGVRRYTVPKESGPDWDYDNRNVGATGTKLGIHQFYQPDALSEPQKRAFSALDMSEQQALMGIVLEYTLKMGIDTRLVSLASSIPPQAPVRWLTPDEMLAWNIDNVHRHYSALTFHAYGRSGAYVEVSNLRGIDASYLRMFCQNGVKEPLFAFITDHQGEIAEATSYVRRLLSRMNITFEFGSDKRLETPFQVADLQGLVQSTNRVRVFAVVRAVGLRLDQAERLTRVALEDNGNLSRAETPDQDLLKFRIAGDHRLIGLAMKNCVAATDAMARQP